MSVVNQHSSESFAPSRLVNARDLGGLPLVDGGATRHGVLLRSDAPYRGDLDPEGIVWPPTTVIDLRGSDEGDTTTATWPPGVTVVSSPVFNGARVDTLLDEPLDGLYGTLLDRAGQRVMNALNAFDVEGTTLVHCAAGKDRTGVVIAVALLLAGVERSVIIADYQRTEDAISSVYERMRERGTLKRDISLEHPVFRSPPSAIGSVIDRLSHHPGGVEKWVEEQGGDLDHLRRWRARFVTGSSAESGGTR